jgi:hypothetical protein
MTNDDLHDKDVTAIEQGNLFDTVQLPEGGREKDNTDITTYMLYFSTEEATIFKKMVKQGIKKMYQQEAVQRGNVSDFLMELVKNYNNV